MTSLPNPELIPALQIPTICRGCPRLSELMIVHEQHAEHLERLYGSVSPLDFAKTHAIITESPTEREVGGRITEETVKRGGKLLLDAIDSTKDALTVLQQQVDEITGRCQGKAHIEQTDDLPFGQTETIIVDLCRSEKYLNGGVDSDSPAAVIRIVNGKRQSS